MVVVVEVVIAHRFHHSNDTEDFLRKLDLPTQKFINKIRKMENFDKHLNIFFYLLWVKDGRNLRKIKDIVALWLCITCLSNFVENNKKMLIVSNSHVIRLCRICSLVWVWTERNVDVTVTVGLFSTYVRPFLCIYIHKPLYTYRERAHCIYKRWVVPPANWNSVCTTNTCCCCWWWCVHESSCWNHFVSFRSVRVYGTWSFIFEWFH